MDINILLIAEMLCVKRKDTELNVTVGTVGVDLPRKGKQGEKQQY